MAGKTDLPEVSFGALLDAFPRDQRQRAKSIREDGERCAGQEERQLNKRINHGAGKL